MAELGGVAMGTAVMLTSPRAQAAQQWTAGVDTDLCGYTDREAELVAPAWCGGVVGEVIFGRLRDRDIGWGPALRVSTPGFKDLRVGAGLTALLPVDPTYPLAFSAGPLFIHDAEGSHSGFQFRGFWGARSYNFHSYYSPALGFVFGYQHVFAMPDRDLLFAGIQVDGMWLTLPIVLLINWLAGPGQAR